MMLIPLTAILAFFTSFSIYLPSLPDSSGVAVWQPQASSLWDLISWRKHVEPSDSPGEAIGNTSSGFGQADTSLNTTTLLNDTTPSTSPITDSPEVIITPPFPVTAPVTLNPELQKTSHMPQQNSDAPIVAVVLYSPPEITAEAIDPGLATMRLLQLLVAALVGVVCSVFIWRGASSQPGEIELLSGLQMLCHENAALKASNLRLAQDNRKLRTMAFDAALLKNKTISLRGKIQSRNEEAKKLKEDLRNAQRSLEAVQIVKTSLQAKLKVSREANQELQEKEQHLVEELQATEQLLVSVKVKMHSEPSLSSKDKTAFEPVDLAVEDLWPFGKVTDPAASVANVVSASTQTEAVALGKFDAQTTPVTAGLPSEQMKTDAQDVVRKDHLSQADRAMLTAALAKSKEEDRVARAAQTGRALPKQTSECKKDRTKTATGNPEKDGSAAGTGHAAPTKLENTATESTTSSQSLLLSECDGKPSQTQRSPETYLPVLLDAVKFRRWRDPSDKPAKEELSSTASKHLDFESQDDNTNEPEKADGSLATTEELSVLNERVSALFISKADDQSTTARSVVPDALPFTTPVDQTAQVCVVKQDEPDLLKTLVKSVEPNEPAKTVSTAESTKPIAVAHAQPVNEAKTDKPNVANQSGTSQSPTSHPEAPPKILREIPGKAQREPTSPEPTEDAGTVSTDTPTSGLAAPLAQNQPETETYKTTNETITASLMSNVESSPDDETMLNSSDDETPRTGKSPVATQIAAPTSPPRPDTEMIDADEKQTSEISNLQTAQSVIDNASSDTKTLDVETYNQPETPGSGTQHDASPQSEEPAIDTMDTTDGPETVNSTSDDQPDIEMPPPPQLDSEDTGNTLIGRSGFGHTNSSGLGRQITSTPFKWVNSSDDASQISPSPHPGEIFKVFDTTVTETAVTIPITAGAVQSSGIGLSFSSYKCSGTFTFGQPTNSTGTTSTPNLPQRPETSSGHGFAYSSIEPSLRKHVLPNLSLNHPLNSRPELLARKKEEEAEEERTERQMKVWKEQMKQVSNKALSPDSDGSSDEEDVVNDDYQYSNGGYSTGDAGSDCEQGEPLTGEETHVDEEEDSDSDNEQFNSQTSPPEELKVFYSTKDWKKWLARRWLIDDVYPQHHGMRDDYAEEAKNMTGWADSILQQHYDFYLNESIIDHYRRKCVTPSNGSSIDARIIEDTSSAIQHNQPTIDGRQLQSNTDNGNQLAPQDFPFEHAQFFPFDDSGTDDFSNFFNFGEVDGQQYGQNGIYDLSTGLKTGDDDEQQDSREDFADSNRDKTFVATTEYSDTNPTYGQSIGLSPYGPYSPSIADMTPLTQGINPTLPQMGVYMNVPDYSTSPQYLRSASTQQTATVAPQLLQPGLTIPTESPPFFPSQHPSYKPPPRNDFDDEFDNIVEMLPDSLITAESNDQEEVTPYECSPVQERVYTYPSPVPSFQHAMSEEDQSTASPDSAQEVPSIPVGIMTFSFQSPAPTSTNVNGTDLFVGQSLPGFVAAGLEMAQRRRARQAGARSRVARRPIASSTSMRTALPPHIPTPPRSPVPAPFAPVSAAPSTMSASRMGGNFCYTCFTSQHNTRDCPRTKNYATRQDPQP